MTEHDFLPVVKLLFFSPGEEYHAYMSQKKERRKSSDRSHFHLTIRRILVVLVRGQTRKELSILPHSIDGQRNIWIQDQVGKAECMNPDPTGNGILARYPWRVVPVRNIAFVLSPRKI